LSILSLEKKGCPREQLANLTYDYDILIDKEIWDALPETDKAALYIHEIIYQYFRDYLDDKDSRRAILFTGYLIGTHQFMGLTPVRHKLPKSRLTCLGDAINTFETDKNGVPVRDIHYKTFFQVFKGKINSKDEEKIYIFLETVGGLPMITRTYSLSVMDEDLANKIANGEKVDRNDLYPSDLSIFTKPLNKNITLYANTTGHGSPKYSPTHIRIKLNSVSSTKGYHEIELLDPLDKLGPRNIKYKFKGRFKCVQEN